MGEFIKLMGAPDSLAIWPFFARELEVSFRHKFAPDLPSRSRAARRLEEPLYPRVGAGRLMFGTPTARRPYLFNDLVLSSVQRAPFQIGRDGAPSPSVPLRVSTSPREIWSCCLKLKFSFFV